MAISVVNGYLCMNSCDAATARTGQNPHPSTASAPSGSGANNQKSDANNGAAVVYGGVLAHVSNANSGAPAPISANTPSVPSINVLA
jgi:hypothetical protein